MSTPVITAVGRHSVAESVVRRIYERAARLDRFGMAMLRLGLIVVLVWIGALKFADYEADGIVPLVARVPLNTRPYFEFSSGGSSDFRSPVLRVEARRADSCLSSDVNLSCRVGNRSF